MPVRDLKHADPLVQLRAVMGQWLPLGRTVLRTVVQQLPSAAASQAGRLAHLCPPLSAVAPAVATGVAPAPAAEVSEPAADGGAISSAAADAALSAPASAASLQHLRRAIDVCDASAEAPVHIHVAKMVFARGVAGAHPDDAFVGLARVFSGMLEPGRAHGRTLQLHRIGTDNAVAPPELVPIDALRLYTLMGRELVPTAYVGAGGVFGLGGLGDVPIKSATLCSLPGCPPFEPLALQGAPIVQVTGPLLAPRRSDRPSDGPCDSPNSPLVQVALEPQQLGLLPQLEAGLQLLARADPSVDVAQLPSGEHVIATCGEVHLERCLHDLRTTFAPGLEVVASPPIVPLHESVAFEAAGRGEAATTNKLASLGVRALRLPAEVRACVDEHKPALRTALLAAGSWLGLVSASSADASVRAALLALRRELGAAAKPWSELQPLSATLRGACVNVLLAAPNVAESLRGGGGAAADGGDGGPDASSDVGGDGGANELLPSVLSGFQLAASNGPLCEEPMDDVAFVLDELRGPTAAEAAAAELQSGELEGQLIVAAKEACRAAVLAGSPRVLEPVYLCELQTSQDSMGKTYGVLSKRRAVILSEDLKEGTPIFTIRAHLPVAESFGFATDLRKTTSGAAHPQLIFAHFEALPQDPNFAVTSEEDQEALDDGDLPTINLARKLVDDVRRRKGLRVDEKVVQSATKQRTRTKMK